MSFITQHVELLAKRIVTTITRVFTMGWMLRIGFAVLVTIVQPFADLLPAFF